MNILRGYENCVRYQKLIELLQSGNVQNVFEIYFEVSVKNISTATFSQ